MDQTRGTEINKNVLVIDDEPGQLQVLSDILKSEKLTPICCRKGKEALEVYKTEEFNVAILDLRLQDMDGLLLLQKLKKQNPNIKVIINTAYATLESAMGALNKEAFAFIRKMDDVEELLRHVHRAFHSHLIQYSEKLEGEVRKGTAELLKANEKYRILFHHSKDGIFLHDLAGNILEVNQKVLELLGYERSEIRSMELKNLHPPNAVGLCKASLKKVFDIGFANFEIEFRKKNGEVFPADVWSSLFEIQGQQMVQGIIRDISERKRLETELRNSREQLRKLSMYLQSEIENERSRIARELHDELGQAMTILQFNLTRLKERISENDKENLENITSMSNSVKTILSQIQRIAYKLRPSVLDNLGIVAAIESYAREFEKSTRIPCRLDLNIDDNKVKQDYIIQIFRVVQEALTNIARHSEATSVEISFTDKKNNFFLKISDNGKGLTKDDIDNTTSMGLLGMQERVSYMKGTFSIKGNPDLGTTLTVSIPL